MVKCFDATVEDPERCKVTLSKLSTITHFTWSLKVSWFHTSCWILTPTPFNSESLLKRTVYSSDGKVLTCPSKHMIFSFLHVANWIPLLYVSNWMLKIWQISHAHQGDSDRGLPWGELEEYHYLCTLVAAEGPLKCRSNLSLAFPASCWRREYCHPHLADEGSWSFRTA